jgi:hypothetical protein
MKEPEVFPCSRSIVHWPVVIPNKQHFIVGYDLPVNVPPHRVHEDLRVMHILFAWAQKGKRVAKAGKKQRKQKPKEQQVKFTTGACQRPRFPIPKAPCGEH